MMKKGDRTRYRVLDINRTVKSITAHSKTELGYSGNVDDDDNIILMRIINFLK